jgi:hypothetical protein
MFGSKLSLLKLEKCYTTIIGSGTGRGLQFGNSAERSRRVARRLRVLPPARFVSCETFS